MAVALVFKQPRSSDPTALVFTSPLLGAVRSLVLRQGRLCQVADGDEFVYGPLHLLPNGGWISGGVGMGVVIEGSLLHQMPEGTSLIF